MKTISKQDNHLRNTGVRWSELNQLPYHNIVEHIPLGMMHNWLEGVLQHHFRVRWGFDTWLVQNQQRKHEESGKQPPPKFVRLHTGNCETEDSESSDDSSNEENISNFGDGPFSEEKIQKFKKAHESLILPSELEQPPQPLGD